MPKLSDAQIAGAVASAGFPRSSQTTAVAVALAESSGNSDATNRNSNGSTDYGLFQINSVHSDLLRTHSWSDPVDNARMALEISSGGKDWSPWVAYTTGRFAAYLPRAKRATGAPVSPGITGSGIGDTGVPNPNLWARIAWFILGSALIILGIGRITKLDDAARKIGVKGLELLIFKKAGK